ncbi:hypothetical protein QQS21_003407 [Conoideocrella luteorostrata]|uniref:Amidohydrolase-related domain-containing protein n=1 Tax=Conoideocrella luteorostrata TaxID=1105319 RepID=A0AAJ0CTE4_9HYPO|nr:hypothetical protein QQS21_003407 [Conoideocrella luteorostrata]
MAVKILQGGTVIGFDDDAQAVRVLPKASVVIEDDHIAAILRDSEFDDYAIPANADIINVEGKIVSPGFVNTHVHMWQTAYRTIGPDIVLAQYFGNWLSQMSDDAKLFTPDDIYISCLQGYLEGLHSGVTSYVDHAHNNWASDVVEPGFTAAEDSGARVWWCYDVAHREAFPLQDQWKALARVASKATPSSLVQPGISLDSLSGSFQAEEKENHLQNTKQMLDDLNLKAITLHHMNGPWPNDGHSSPVQICKHNLHSKQRPIIFSHAPFLDSEEQQALSEHDVFVSITPESECHFGHGQVSGRNVSKQAALGLDTNWTFSGDMLFQARLWLQNVRLTSFHQTLQKGLLPRETPFTVEQGFLMATRQGGLALRRRDIGVLQVGAQADIVVFDGDSPNMLGWSNPVAAVMLHANPGDIEHVLVAGRFVKRDFKLVNMKLAWTEVRERFLKTARRIQAQAANAPPLPEKVWGVGEMGDVEVSSTI